MNSRSERKRLGLAIRKLAAVIAEGTCPGNNSCLVATRSVATLGGLQQRLLQLGQRVGLHVD